MTLTRFCGVREEKSDKLVPRGGVMTKKQPSYTKEFKQEAVKLVESSNKTKSEIARDLGISDSADAVNGAKNLQLMVKRHF